jgi:hypothetical protein
MLYKALYLLKQCIRELNILFAEANCICVHFQELALWLLHDHLQTHCKSEKENLALSHGEGLPCI